MKTCGHDGAAIELSGIRICPECAKLPEYARRVRNLRRRSGTALTEHSAQILLMQAKALASQLSSQPIERRVYSIARAALEELSVGNVAIATRLAKIALEGFELLK